MVYFPNTQIMYLNYSVANLDIQIRPVINNRTSPAYKLTKHLAKILNQYIMLNNHYTVTNSTNLANDLTKLEIHKNHRMITLDIKDLYINIPIDETLTYVLTPWSSVILEKLTSKLCS